MSKIALVVQGADFSKVGKGQVRLNIGTRYSVIFPGINGYSVTPDFVYDGTSVKIRIVPNSGKTFIAAEAQSGTPSAPSVTMNGAAQTVTLVGDAYECNIGCVKGTVTVSGGSAVVQKSVYIVNLSLGCITASLSQLGSAIDSVKIVTGKSRVVYLTTAGNYVLPLNASAFTVDGCEIGYVRTNDHEGYISVTPSGNGSVSGNALHVDKPVYELTDEIVRNTGANSTAYIDTGIAPFANGFRDFTILCKFKPSDVSAKSNTYNASYVFGCANNSGGVYKGLSLATTPSSSSGTTAAIRCYKKAVSYTPAIHEYIIYISGEGASKTMYYKLYDATENSVVDEGAIVVESTTSKVAITLKIGGAQERTYNMGYKGAIHNFRYYDEHIKVDSDTVITYFNI